MTCFHSVQDGHLTLMMTLSSVLIDQKDNQWMREMPTPSLHNSLGSNKMGVTKDATRSQKISRSQFGNKEGAVV